MAERMINLSIGGANAGDIFPHANVKNARNRAEKLKIAKTTPCTVAGARENNDLRLSEIDLDSSGKTGAGWHRGGVADGPVPAGLMQPSHR
jgi:hypothetical protein